MFKETKRYFRELKNCVRDLYNVAEGIHASVMSIRENFDKLVRSLPDIHVLSRS